MKISLIAVGRLKTPHWAAAQKEYVERIRRYAPLSVLEVKDRVGLALEDQAAMEKEGNDILEAVENIPGVIALVPSGKLLASPAWAAELQRLSETYSRLAFVIGGPVGLSPAVLQKSVLKLSLSSMTFPHEMARIVFLEQLYRAFTILKGEKYHK